ncbi:ATP synthase subunit c [uncultured Alphaproteobacteria bacterium]|jgi:F-type H+-transporting ATPase subunit c|uniref:ATP synthase F(0) sector subunit c n=1 Tax=uncultured Alphaproteobacteria bacterium TaxID=91750 RepID=A0A212JVI5_9PROT|nr:ATP synthase subunit c [uncultured Alphaproteobacteria bacterium]
MDAEAAKYIGAGLVNIGLCGAALAVGSIWSTLITTVGRNPAARASVELYGWVGFAVTEAIGLFALVVALITLFA